MASKPNKGGRPKKQLDRARIADLASNMCTVEEIAADQNCNKKTLERRVLSQVIKRGRELAKLSLRAKQFQVAMGRPAQPAVYLRERVDEKGRQSGELVKDKDGNPILLRAELPEVKPDKGMLIWLGKQFLGQSDKVQWEEGDGFDFVGGGG